MIDAYPHHPTPTGGTPLAELPPGTPKWIDSELIARTLRVFQAYYSERLSAEDAVGMIQRMGRLIATLARGSSHEEVRRVGESVISAPEERGLQP